MYDIFLVMLTDPKQVITFHLQFQNQLRQKKKPKQVLRRRVRSDLKLKGSMWVYSTTNHVGEDALLSVFHYYNNIVIYFVCVDLSLCIYISFLYICTVCVQEPTVTKAKVKPAVAKKGKDNRKKLWLNLNFRSIFSLNKSFFFFFMI